jgi:hypothetical protein
MSRVISDSQQTIVRASQLGDVIVSVKKPTITSSPSTLGFFSAILNIDVVFKSITLLCANSHTLQNFDHNESPGLSSSNLFRGDGDITVVAVDGSFPLEATPGFTLFTTASQENLLSNAGSFTALDTTPLFDVT